VQTCALPISARRRSPRCRSATRWWCRPPRARSRGGSAGRGPTRRHRGAPRAPTGPSGPRVRQLTCPGSCEVPQSRFEVGLEVLEKALLVVAGRVEDQVVEAGVDVLLDLLDRVVGVGGDDPPLGHLLDGELV